ncbi:hypothetical protein GCM10010430_73200 [Kitasatospora cystarginea]|uniref:Uncharacterized protein n=1 Tax=Kitasatospora cystarginea TaxID=58350 RepID=A0ABP5RX30_9ACTN
MKSVRGAGPDRACLLPGRPGWIRDVVYLDDQVLDHLASVAAANVWRDDDRYLLPVDTYQIAAMTITALAGAVPENGRAGQVVLHTLPAWKLEVMRGMVFAAAMCHLFSMVGFVLVLVRTVVPLKSGGVLVVKRGVVVR